MDSNVERVTVIVMFSVCIVIGLDPGVTVSFIASAIRSSMA